MASTREEQLTLLMLPREIRLRIYEYVFADSEVFLDRQSRHGKPWSMRYDQEVCMFRKEDLQVLMSCRAIWSEGAQSVHTARVKQCCGATETTRINYQLCYLLLSEAQGLNVKHLITTCSHVRCVKSILHYQVTPYLETIEWYTPKKFNPPPTIEFLPTNTTILRSEVLEPNEWDRHHHMAIWKERIYDVRVSGSRKHVHIVIKPW